MLPKKCVQVILPQMYCTQFYSVYFDMYNTCSKYLGSLKLCLNLLELLSTTVVPGHQSCSIIVVNHQQACFINYCRLLPNNIIPAIVPCQHRLTIVRTMLIDIVSSTSVVEP